MFRKVALGIMIGLAVLLTSAMLAKVWLDRAIDKAKCVRIESDSRFYHMQLEAYRASNGAYPTTEQGLDALVEEPTSAPCPAHWHQLAETIVTDDWNTSYIYRCPGKRYPQGYDFFSAGRDRKPDTKDDVWR